jgi:hypothetical protein
MTYFEIDMLKGAHVPTKSQPLAVALAMVPIIVLLLILVAVLLESVQGGINLTTREKQLARVDRQVAGLAGEVAYVARRNAAISQSQAEMADVEGQVARQIQYTPILRAAAEELPENLLMTNLEVVSQSRQRNIPHPEEPNRMITTFVIERAIHITVCDVADGGTVSDYVGALHNSEAMNWLIEDIEPTGRDSTRIAGHEVVSYDIDCRLLPR